MFSIGVYECILMAGSSWATSCVFRREHKAADDYEWKKMFDKLCEYKEKYGHCRILEMSKEEWGNLGNWVSVQRECYKCHPEVLAGTYFNDKCIKRLEKIGFEWIDETETDDYAWWQMFKKLCEYWIKHGHCRVPEFLSEDDWGNLGKWASLQRDCYHKCHRE